MVLVCFLMGGLAALFISEVFDYLVKCRRQRELKEIAARTHEKEDALAWQNPGAIAWNSTRGFHFVVYASEVRRDEWGSPYRDALIINARGCHRTDLPMWSERLAE